MSSISMLLAESVNASSVLFLFVVWIILIVGYLFKSKNRGFPGGPRGVPFLGYLPFLDTKRLHKSLAALRRYHGDVFSLKIGGQMIVVLNGAAVIREAFVTKGSSFDGRPVWMLNKVNQGRGIANEQPTREWQNHRKSWLKLMRNIQMSKVSMEDIISRDVRCIISTLESSNGEPIDISKTVHMALCNVICSICFGKSFAYDDPAFQHLLKMADQFFHYLSSASAVNFFPILWYLPFKANKAVAEGYDGILNFVKKLVLKSQICADDTHLSFINLAVRGENDAKSTTVNNIDGFPSVNTSTKTPVADNTHYNSDFEDICESVTFVATDLFIGGAETTHAGVMWALAFMIQCPDAQARVQLEIDEVVGHRRLPKWEDRHNLPYTQASIQELLRLGNVIPIAIPHVTTCDVTMDNGCCLPRGTMVMANIYACHMDPNTWREPEHFRPERFLDSAGKLKRFDEFMPFSVGRRICLGEQLARMELFLAFTHILQRFHISLAPGQPPISIDGRPGITHGPRRFKMRATLRKAN